MNASATCTGAAPDASEANLAAAVTPPTSYALDVSSRDNKGWSLYGAPCLQPVAIGLQDLDSRQTRHTRDSFGGPSAHAGLSGCVTCKHPQPLMSWVTPGAETAPGVTQRSLCRDGSRRSLGRRRRLARLEARQPLEPPWQ